MRERDRRLLLRFRDLDRLSPPRPWPTADILRSRAGAEPSPESPRWRRVASVAVALAVAVAGITFGIWALLPLESERQPAGASAESIAFVRDVGRNQEILVMNGDGTGLIRLTHSPPDLPEDQAADIQPAWSPDGTRIAFASKRDGNFEIYAMNADGSQLTRLTDDPAEAVEPAWSPDGAKIAFTRDRGTPGVSGDIYVMNADGSDVTRLTDDPANDRHPSWSPNGAQIAFQSDRAAGGLNSDIYLMNADGTGVTRLTSGPSDDAAPAWSPDGSKIAYEESPPDGDLEIAVMNANGSDKTLLTDNDTGDADPDWSPDGSKIAFIRMLPDRSVSIFAINADGTGEKQLTNAELLDSGPAWRPQRAETPSPTPSGPPSAPSSESTEPFAVWPEDTPEEARTAGRYKDPESVVGAFARVVLGWDGAHIGVAEPGHGGATAYAVERGDGPVALVIADERVAGFWSVVNVSVLEPDLGVDPPLSVDIWGETADMYVDRLGAETVEFLIGYGTGEERRAEAGPGVSEVTIDLSGVDRTRQGHLLILFRDANGRVFVAQGFPLPAGDYAVG